MASGRFGLIAEAAGAALVAALLALPAAAQEDAGAVPSRGAYVFDAAGCLGCHTDVANAGAPLAGGRALETPFGTFWSPNITPDPDHGIGAWTLADFRRAMRRGIGPDGTTYYPSFPYDYFTRMSDADIEALYDHLMAQPPSDNQPPEHDLAFPFSLRPLLAVWRWLYFEEGPRSDEGLDPELARGRYLADALGHCGACHTPRTALGGSDEDRYLAGNAEGPDDETVPNITPDMAHGIGDWTEGDLLFLLKAGMMPDGDVVSGSMAEVVQNSTRRLTDEDIAALIVWLRAIPAVDHDPRAD